MRIERLCRQVPTGVPQPARRNYLCCIAEAVIALWVLFESGIKPSRNWPELRMKTRSWRALFWARFKFGLFARFALVSSDAATIWLAPALLSGLNCRLWGTITGLLRTEFEMGRVFQPIPPVKTVSLHHAHRLTALRCQTTFAAACGNATQINGKSGFVHG